MQQDTTAPLIDKNYQLEKFAGKGSWTYAQIPEILQNKNNPFGWVRVRGSIDGIELKGYHLMPMGNGKLFLPVKAAIRKQIKKQEGDWVHVILYADDTPTEIPEELIVCLKDEPGAYEKFMVRSNGEKRAFIEWIYSAKTEDTKANRIVKTIELVLQGLTLSSKTN
jgi:hypothetical protein